MPVNGRAKGAGGERDFINAMRDLCGELISDEVKRNLEQVRNGGHDIVGMGNWAVEVKRYKSAGDADIRKWWEQAVKQANDVSKLPVLAYRLDRREWRVRVPLSHLMDHDHEWTSIEWTAELSIYGFAHVFRESISNNK